jgi:3-hydroxyisobutyrate dehydrogenase-like beta-hydroxyacid dehydrogenase
LDAVSILIHISYYQLIEKKSFSGETEMAENTIGVLHPGAMGVTVGSSIKAGGHRVIWTSEGRSALTENRAAEAGLENIKTLSGLVQESDVIISVCPPHAGLDVARAVVSIGYSGVYVDVNAVSPATSRSIMQIVNASGAHFVDGGIIGPPALKANRTRLYLSGESADEVKALFNRGNMQAITISGKPGQASALKMCYAAWTKGSAAMLLAIRGLAEAEGVTRPLLDEWAISQPGLEAHSKAAAIGTAPKAWRFVGEMEEIAATFRDAGLPDQFHMGAAALYAMLEEFKDQAEPAQIENVLEALKQNSKAR